MKSPDLFDVEDDDKSLDEGFRENTAKGMR